MQNDPWAWTANASLQATGLIRGREADRAGAGYFYDGLSNGFKNLVSALPNEELQSLQGVELYYNAAITPWFNMTADFQVVDNENVNDEAGILFGLRGKIMY